MDSTDSASGGPVFRVGLTSKTTLRTLNRMICEFYGHPGTDRANAARLASYAVDCVLSCDTRIGVIDDIHFINPAHKDGLDVSNHLKWLATPQPPPTGLPDLLLRAVQGQSSCWTRLERFAVTMTHPSIDAAAATSVSNTCSTVSRASQRTVTSRRNASCGYAARADCKSVAHTHPRRISPCCTPCQPQQGSPTPRAPRWPVCTSATNHSEHRRRHHGSPSSAAGSGQVFDRYRSSSGSTTARSSLAARGDKPCNATARTVLVGVVVEMITDRAAGDPAHRLSHPRKLGPAIQGRGDRARPQPLAL